MFNFRHSQHQEPSMTPSHMAEDKRPPRPAPRRPRRKRYGVFHWFIYWVGVAALLYLAIRGIVYLFVIFGSPV